MSHADFSVDAIICRTMPIIYRAMKRDEQDGLPVVGTTNSSQLGVRPGTDIAVDEHGDVSPGDQGMSVSPRWRDLGISRIPRRLHHLVPGAVGGNNTACYRFGEGPFEHGDIAAGLILIPDADPLPARHGVIGPAARIGVDRFQENLAATRPHWTVDEA